MSSLKIPVSHSDHHRGSANAPVTLVEYGDYQCPHCARAEPVVQQVRERFGDQFRFVFRNFPLNTVHPQAERAAEVAEFAAAHGKFWNMHDLLFDNQDRLGDPLYLELADALGLSAEAMVEALESGIYRVRVKADFDGGIRSGVNGTPIFFVNGVRHDGPNDPANLSTAIERALGPAA